MECFSVHVDDIEGRIDPHFYKPEFVELNEKLTKLKHKKLGDVVNFSSVFISFKLLLATQASSLGVFSSRYLASSKKKSFDLTKIM